MKGNLQIKMKKNEKITRKLNEDRNYIDVKGKISNYMAGLYY